MVVTGTHNPYLVALSILVAAFASYTALDLGGHVAAARGLARRVWLVTAAVTMGGGIWSMHFVAMLAFTMPIPMSYDIGLTTLSLLVAIFVTGGGFYVISRKGTSPLRLVFSGIFMGLGIVAMHYTGMAAMRGHAEFSYDRLYVALSIVIAIGASTAALWLAFRTTDLGQKLVAAVPNREIADADGADLALLEQGMHGLRGFLDRHQWVGPVDLVDVDVIGSKPAQRILDLLQDARAAGIAEDFSTLPLKPHLGRDEHARAKIVVGEGLRQWVSAKVWLP